jgi:hypothetical protein
MRRIVIPTFALLLLVPLLAQAQEIEPPTYTLDQRWTRSVRFNVNGMVTLISLGKEKGMTVDEIGAWMGTFYRQGWTQGPREPSDAVIAFYRNHMVNPTAEMEVLSVSEDEASVRFNRPHLLVFGDDMNHLGVTVDEYEKVMMTAQGIIGKWIGLDLEQRIEGNWLYLTFKK